MRSFVLCGILLLASCTSSRRIAQAPAPPQAVATEDRDEDEKEGNDAAEWYLSRRVAPGAGELDATRYTQAATQIARMPRLSAAAGKRSTAISQAWTSLGPGNVGGRTRAFLI